MATPASATAFSTAVRRVVVTPTFAAGLGVVIAAAMAYPMTKTVISYGGAPPVGETPCLLKGCVGGTDGSGSLATSGPGTRLVPSSTPTDPDPAVTGTGGGVVAGAQPVMQYQTLRQWQSGFIGQITIVDSSGSVPAQWQLRLDYESAHIIGVWGGRWSASGDGVLVTPDDGGIPGEGGHVQVVVVVSGRPGPPSGCAFNGQACRTEDGGSGGGPASGNPQPEHQQPGGQQGNSGPGGQFGR